MADVQRRITMARLRHGKMRHIWKSSDLHVNLKMRLYKASVCSILTYGSEAWTLISDVMRALNGANASMVSVITNKSAHDEASTDTRTFDVVRWIRARRLQWVGHILRMDTSRMLHQTVKHLFIYKKEGDLLMDVPKGFSWAEMCEIAKDRDRWRVMVRALRTPRVKISMKTHKVPAQTLKYTCV